MNKLNCDLKICEQCNNFEHIKSSNAIYCNCVVAQDSGATYIDFWNGRILPESCLMKLEYIVLQKGNKGD